MYAELSIRRSLSVAFVTASLAFTNPSASCAEQPTDNAPTVSDAPKILRDTDRYFEVEFSYDPESRLIIDAEDERLLVKQPEEKGFAPKIDRVESITYGKTKRRMWVRLDPEDDGELESYEFEPLDEVTWNRLESFLERHPDLDIRTKEAE